MQQWNCHCARERSYRPGQETPHSEGWFQTKRPPVTHIILCSTVKWKLSDSFASRLKELRWPKTLTGCSAPKVKENTFRMLSWRRVQQEEFYFYSGKNVAIKLALTNTARCVEQFLPGLLWKCSSFSVCRRTTDGDLKLSTSSQRDRWVVTWFSISSG